MLSLAQFRYNCFSLFKVLSSSNMILEVAHKGVVYDVTITKTDKVAKIARPKRRVKPQIMNIDTEVCLDCGSIMFNTICMNRLCTRSKGLASEAIAQISQGK